MKRFIGQYVLLLLSIVFFASCDKEDILSTEGQKSASKKELITIEVPPLDFCPNTHNSRLVYDKYKRTFSWDYNDALIVTWKDNRGEWSTTNFHYKSAGKNGTAIFEGPSIPEGSSQIKCYYKAKYLQGTAPFFRMKYNELLPEQELSDVATHIKDYALIQSDSHINLSDFKKGNLKLKMQNSIMRFDLTEVHQEMLKQNIPAIVTWEINNRRVSMKMKPELIKKGSKLYFLFDPNYFNGCMDLNKHNIFELSFQYGGKKYYLRKDVSNQYKEGTPKLYTKNHIYAVNVQEKRSEHTLYKWCKEEKKENPRVGDFMLKDGSFINKGDALFKHYKKDVIGIVAFLATKEHFLKANNGDKKGLVLALKNNGTSSFWKGEYRDDKLYSIDYVFSNSYNQAADGLLLTNKMKESKATVLSGYDSFSRKTPAPEGTTEWYLPSLREWIHIMGDEGLGKASGIYKYDFYGNVTNTMRLNNIGNEIDDAFSALSKEQYDPLNIAGGYWTSTRLNESTIYYMYYHNKTLLFRTLDFPRFKGTNNYVRYVLAF